MSQWAWLTQDAIPTRRTVAITLPDDLNWRSQFLGALLLLTEAKNWEQFGTLTPDEMAEEWLKIWLEFQGGQTSMIPIGTVLEYAGNDVPEGFLWARGQAVSRETYSDLFDIIGVTYGPGNGVDTFNVPHRAGTFGVGLDPNDTDYDSLNNQGGQKEHFLTVAEMPSHTVIQNAHTHVQNAHTHVQNSHVHNVWGFLVNVALGASAIVRMGLVSGTQNTVSDSTTATNQNATATNQNATATNQAIGGDQAHENRPPYVTMNYIIKY